MVNIQILDEFGTEADWTSTGVAFLTKVSLENLMKIQTYQKDSATKKKLKFGTYLSGDPVISDVTSLTPNWKHPN